jgi:cytosine/adenosine deaminase-related metal-dependent hydrolase
VTQSTSRGCTFVNASLGASANDVGVTSVRVVGSRISALGCDPRPSDLVIDLAGDRLLPGLINAHDHLQLNSFPPLEYEQSYGNVREWIAEINARTRCDPAFRSAGQQARDTRLLHGGVKNLLSGVTTVAHHDPLYELLSDPVFPTGVVAHYGWSHSLGIDGEERVLHSYASTPRDWPWIIHAAEGTDADAAGELQRLEALSCLAGNTLLVHGVALDRAQRRRLVDVQAGLVWCPTSNLRLFGKSADVADLVAIGRVALGSDSRLSGARDLLCELRVARELGGLDEASLQSLVTEASARLLRIPDRGTVAAGTLADLLVLPRSMALASADRGDIRMVMVGGRMRYGDVAYARAVAPASQWLEVTVDGCSKALDRVLAERLSRAGVREPGLEVPESAWRAA